MTAFGPKRKSRKMQSARSLVMLANRRATWGKLGPEGGLRSWPTSLPESATTDPYTRDLMPQAALRQIQYPIQLYHRSLMGSLVQQAFIRHAPQGG
jgi:hypothetical protein